MQERMDSFVTAGIGFVCYSQNKSFYFRLQGPFSSKSCFTDFTAIQFQTGSLWIDASQMPLMQRCTIADSPTRLAF